MSVDKIRFQTNVPVELALQYTEGKECDSQFGGAQYMYSTTDGRCFFVDKKVAQKIHGLRLKPGEPIDICKAEVSYGNGRKGIEWQISRVGSPPGEQPDGTFVVPAVPPNGKQPGTGGVTPAPATEEATATQPPQGTYNGNGSTPGNGANAQPYGNGAASAAPQAPRSKTVFEDILKTVVEACYSAQKHAKAIGYEAMPQFSGEDIRTMADTLLMQRPKQQGGGQ